MMEVLTLRQPGLWDRLWEVATGRSVGRSRARAGAGREAHEGDAGRRRGCGVGSGESADRRLALEGRRRGRGPRRAGGT